MPLLPEPWALSPEPFSGRVFVTSRLCLLQHHLDAVLAVLCGPEQRDARGLAATTILQGLPAEGYFAAAETAGLSHASLRAAYPLGKQAAA